MRRIGAYKSAGDQLLREDMSDAQREQLTALLQDITADFCEARRRAVAPARFTGWCCSFRGVVLVVLRGYCVQRVQSGRVGVGYAYATAHWALQVVAASREGKTAEDVRALLDAGVYDMQVLKDQGWVTDLKYADEVEELLKARTGTPRVFGPLCGKPCLLVHDGSLCGACWLLTVGWQPRIHCVSTLC